jgi:chromate reductase, NAD(P)H dehydrogenase (quinone)
MTILGLNGSLRRDSYNGRLLRVAAAELGSAAELALLDRLAELPAYNEDIDGGPAPESVRHLRTAIARADGVLIATPEYNASIPGALKNALDWASRPFPDNVLRGKPVAVIGASTGLYGAVWAQAELRRVLAAIGARVIEEELPVARAHVALVGTDMAAELRSRLAVVLARLLESIEPATEGAA